MSAVKVRNGDRVRVVLEGEARQKLGDSFTVGEKGNANYVFPEAEHVVSIEVLKPPEPEYETFGPGDVIQNIAFPSYIYTLLPDNQYLSHVYARVWNCGGDGFTSQRYQRVKLTTVPF